MRQSGITPLSAVVVALDSATRGLVPFRHDTLAAFLALLLLLLILFTFTARVVVVVCCCMLLLMLLFVCVRVFLLFFAENGAERFR